MRGTKPVIGLLGGVGAGKSTVAAILKSLGAIVADADRMAHAVLDEPAIMSEIAAAWGAEAIGADGRVDRKRLADCVFGSEPDRRRLEAIIHPRVIEMTRRLIEEAEREPAVTAVVIDAPLLLEAEMDRTFCDVLLFVESPANARASRTQRERGWAESEHRRREASQKPVDFKREQADEIIVNDSNLADLNDRVSRVFSNILSQFSNRRSAHDA